MSPDTLEDFLTKSSRVSDPWCENSSLFRFAHLAGNFICFFKEFTTNTALALPINNKEQKKYRRTLPLLLHNKHMSTTPSLQSSCLTEYVFVGLSDSLIESNTLRSVTSVL